MNNKSDTVESLIKKLVLKELFRQINKIDIAKTNKPQDKCILENKTKIQVPMLKINRKSLKKRTAESEDTKMYQRKKELRKI